MSEPEPQGSRRQLLGFRFPPGSGFEGQLVGALERIESGGALRIRGAVFVGREADSGDLVAVTMNTRGQAGMIGRLLSFRLDADARRKVTEEALAGPLGPVVRDLAPSLEAGGAVAAVLVEHAWNQVLGEAIARIGGEPVVDRFVEIDELAAAPEVLAELGPV